MNTILSVAKSAINLIYPLRCAACNKTLAASMKEPVCGFCAGRIAPHPRPFCSLCGRSMHEALALCRDCQRVRPAFTMARSACTYDDTLKELIHHFKYNNMRSLSGLFIRLMTDFLKDELALGEGADFVTFVPLHRTRLSERGFNQSKVLARGVSEYLGKPLLDCLEKSKQTKHQNELQRSERLDNLKLAFRIRRGSRESLEGRSILLVDDVMTTGATLDECARALLGAGVRDVRCLTAARGS